MKLTSYLMQELKTPDSSFASVWSSLSDKDKADLRNYAREEMTTLGIAITE